MSDFSKSAPDRGSKSAGGWLLIAIAAIIVLTIAFMAFGRGPAEAPTGATITPEAPAITEGTAGEPPIAPSE
ncbi:hypothetical protein IV417_07390 [Alphaproteobacteria bacterium KMM 3653]|uniref:Uncharacterized protein n=1 Tax=Harenicola maris TaxID=2841044 RepID=A0AAP2CMN0_9RHOB|nr:hypothetical protein [Harenicola maris]